MSFYLNTKLAAAEPGGSAAAAVRELVDHLCQANNRQALELLLAELQRRKLLPKPGQ